MVHPSEKIKGELSNELEGKKIVVGVTGSIAIYKTIDLVRNLMRRGADIKVVMSKDAKKLISPSIFEWATGNKVVEKLTGDLEHVRLAEENDAFIIAPATANTIAKIAYGIADTTITSTALNFIGLKKPLIIVPSMHIWMYKSQQIEEAITKLKEMGIEIVSPILIRDVAHYPDIEFLSNFITVNILRGKDLIGLKILVTAGPTREYLDPVRFITNPSSGLMGVSIANEAYFRGSDTVLVHGPLNTEIKPYVEKKIQVETTEEMKNAVEEKVKEGYNIVILAGAPADYKFKVQRDSKIDSHKEIPIVEFERTQKISESIRKYDVFMVGFSAETAQNDEELLTKAKVKKERHGFDIIVANNVSRKDIGFSSPYNEVILLGSNFTKKISKQYKYLIARELLDIIKEEFKKKFIR
jgi:phosphopantothenoylcysteine decarboxylase/phosphopantothenate--cysteine ligase